MNAKRLRPLVDFEPVAFSKANCPAVLLAISGALAEDIAPAARDAIAKVRGIGSQAPDIDDLTVNEMDYAFTNLGFFVSRVGDYRDRSMTLSQWAARPRSKTVYYAVELRHADGTAAGDGEILAVLGDDAVSYRLRTVTPISSAVIAERLVGQVYTVTAMADARWSA